jgi:serine/threonine protein kinase
VIATFTLPPDHSRVAIVTPLIEGGSLLGVLEWRAGSPPTRRSRRDGDTPIGALSEDEVKAVVRQVLEGLAYLHNHGFLHVSHESNNSDQA